MEAVFQIVTLYNGDISNSGSVKAKDAFLQICMLLKKLITPLFGIIEFMHFLDLLKKQRLKH
jgi:hypothetical protein